VQRYGSLTAKDYCVIMTYCKYIGEAISPQPTPKAQKLGTLPNEQVKSLSVDLSTTHENLKIAK
jgi:hypothetical protein